MLYFPQLIDVFLENNTVQEETRTCNIHVNYFTFLCFQTTTAAIIDQGLQMIVGVFPLNTMRSTLCLAGTFSNVLIEAKKRETFARTYQSYIFFDRNVYFRIVYGCIKFC